MKATKIYHKKLFNLGNFSNSEIGIEIEIEDGEKAKDVMEKAMQFVEMFNPENTKRKEQLERVVENPYGYSYGDVENARNELDKFIKTRHDDELPF